MTLWSRARWSMEIHLRQRLDGNWSDISTWENSIGVTITQRTTSNSGVNCNMPVFPKLGGYQLILMNVSFRHETDPNWSQNFSILRVNEAKSDSKDQKIVGISLQSFLSPIFELLWLLTQFLKLEFYKNPCQSAPELANYCKKIPLGKACSFGMNVVWAHVFQFGDTNPDYIPFPILWFYRLNSFPYSAKFDPIVWSGWNSTVILHQTWIHRNLESVLDCRPQTGGIVHCCGVGGLQLLKLSHYPGPGEKTQMKRVTTDWLRLEMPQTSTGETLQSLKEKFIRIKETFCAQSIQFPWK